MATKSSRRNRSDSSSSESSSAAASSSNASDDGKKTGKQSSAKKPKTEQFIPPPLELSAAPSVGTNNAVDNPKRIIVLLDQARLETVKTRKGEFELLNCDDHRDMCRKYKKDPKELRPDILHQELLALIDSPLNKAGYLQVYIKTQKGILIEVHPSMRVPRTFKRFSGLMVQLLHKLKIKAAGSSSILLKVIKNPFSQHLPPGTRVFALSVKGTLYAPLALANAMVPPSPNPVTSTLAVDKSSAKVQPPVCFIIGAMSSGSITKEDHPYIEDFFSISEYPLSGAAACSRILTAIEHQWGIV